jgi:hypothetical protein
MAATALLYIAFGLSGRLDAAGRMSAEAVLRCATAMGLHEGASAISMGLIKPWNRNK